LIALAIGANQIEWFCAQVGGISNPSSHQRLEINLQQVCVILEMVVVKPRFLWVSLSDKEVEAFTFLGTILPDHQGAHFHTRAVCIVDMVLDLLGYGALIEGFGSPAASVFQ
jgi:hypothetical protein